MNPLYSLCSIINNYYFNNKKKRYIHHTTIKIKIKIKIKNDGKRGRFSASHFEKASVHSENNNKNASQSVSHRSGGGFQQYNR